jgi:hypothetical protein
MEPMDYATGLGQFQRRYLTKGVAFSDVLPRTQTLNHHLSIVHSSPKHRVGSQSGK